MDLVAGVKQIFVVTQHVHEERRAEAGREL